MKPSPLTPPPPSNCLVEMRNVSLAYPTHWEDREVTLKATLSRRRFRRRGRGERTVLNDITLQLIAGQRLGVLGINGAGKSSLMRVIARLVPPTAGTLFLGGTAMILNSFDGGFHPEYTGIQNVELTSLLHGRAVRETRARLEAIAAFADIGRQIHEPVKTYSTGMRMRLAFAIAQSLPFDILLVDEVLAVGDGGFQQKCFEWFESVDWSRKALVFVSHDLDMVNRLTEVCVWVSDGGIVSHGETPGMTHYYRRWLYHEL